MIFNGDKRQAERLCKRHKIKITTKERTKGGVRLCVVVPTDVELKDGTVLKAGPRVIRINPREKETVSGTA